MTEPVKSYEKLSEREKRVRDRSVTQMVNESIYTDIYTDEPIPFRKSSAEEPLPAAYRTIREMAKERLGQSDAWLFCRQGKQIALIKDDYQAPPPRENTFPCYQSLSDGELRGYVSWRTRYLQGDHILPPTVFLKLYAYELINGIGINRATDGLNQLSALLRFSPPKEPWWQGRVARWMMEYTAYYRMDAQLLWNDPLFLANCLDFQQEILTDADTLPNDQVFNALQLLSSYDLTRSRLYREKPVVFRDGICQMYRAAAHGYEDRKGRSLCDLLFGAFCESPCLLFGDAVFLRDKKEEDGLVYLSPRLFFRCRDGFWSSNIRMGFHGKNQMLGKILRTADQLLREALRYSHPLKAENCPLPGISEVMAKVAKTVKEKEQPSPAPLTFDLSQLEGIRHAADQTRDRLLEGSDDNNPKIPEDAPSGRDENNFTAHEKKDFLSVQSPEPPAEPDALPEDVVLAEDEKLLLRALLTGSDPAAALRRKGFVLSMTADTANEKLFDRFGDTVILFDGEKPYLAEDYIDEIKGWMNL